jgi:uroporphyrin-3 C-methyltransferase
LASLARVVESLPLAGEAKKAGDAVVLDTEQSGASRAWSSVKSAMSGLVKVTPPDQPKHLPVSPDAEFFLRNNIALQLQAARLALLRGEQAIFEQALDDTGVLLDTYFDTSSEQVAGAKLTINEIRETVATASAPDISGSLSLLRQYRALRESIE